MRHVTLSIQINIYKHNCTISHISLWFYPQNILIITIIYRCIQNIPLSVFCIQKSEVIQIIQRFYVMYSKSLVQVQNLYRVLQRINRESLYLSYVVSLHGFERYSTGGVIILVNIAIFSVLILSFFCCYLKKNCHNFLNILQKTDR